MAGHAGQPRLHQVPRLRLIDRAYRYRVAEPALELRGCLVALRARGQARVGLEGGVVGRIAEAAEVVGRAAGEGREEVLGVEVVGVEAEAVQLRVAATAEHVVEIGGSLRDLEVDVEWAQRVAQDDGLLLLGLGRAGPVTQRARRRDAGGREDLAGLLDVGGGRREAVQGGVVVRAAAPGATVTTDSVTISGWLMVKVYSSDSPDGSMRISRL